MAAGTMQYNVNKQIYRLNTNPSDTDRTKTSAIEKMIAVCNIRLFMLCLIAVLYLPGMAHAQNPYHILVLHSYHKGLAWTDNIADGIEDTIKKSGIAVETTHEFMDTKRNFTQNYLDQLAILYKTKYLQTQFDLIIVSDDHAFNFVRRHHQDIFKSAPVVFCGVNHFKEGLLEQDRQITGVIESLDILTTLNTALTLHPRANRLIIIADRTLTGNTNKELLNEALPNLKRPMDLLWFDNHTMKEVRDYLSHATDNDIAVWLHFTTDRDGNFFPFHESASLISQASLAPLYSFWDFHLGYGIVGGMLTSGYNQGKKAAEMALKNLQGTPVSAIPVVHQSPNQFMFDRLQMDRFNISEAMLPPGSIIINQPVTFYSQHQKKVWTAAAAFSTLTIIIAILLVSNTRRRQAEATLKKTNDRYRNVFDSTAVALFEENCEAVKLVVDKLLADGETDMAAYIDSHPEFVAEMAKGIVVTAVNPAAMRLYNAKNKDELIGAFHKIFLPDSLSSLKKILIAVSRGQTQFECEATNRTLDEKIIHVILSLTLPAETEAYRGLIVSIVDITDRKLSEEALCRSEDRFRTMFNYTASGMALVDMDGNYLRVNQAFCRMLDYTEQAMVQMNWRDVTHLEDIKLTLAVLDEAKADRSAPPVEKRYLDRQGQIVWALLNVAQIKDDDEKPLYYIAQMQDISKIKAAQAKLREREERYRQIFEADLSGFYIVNPSGELIMCNHVFAKIVGYNSAEEVVGMNFQDFYKDPTMRPQLMAELIRQSKVEHREVEFIKPDGTLIHVLTNAIGRFDDLDRLVEIQGYLMDITRQKNLEAQLLHAQKMESIGTMAGGVAHDFNNLLMGIMGNTSLLQAELEKDHPSYSRLKSIEQYVQSGSDLTRQLLGFAKGGKYEVRTLDLNRLIDRNINMFARTHKSIRVHTDLTEKLRFVEADQSQIDQVLYNLYVNAWQAMETGGDLSIETRNVTLTPAAVEPHGLTPGRYVQIKVADTGIGMTPETLQRIFDPFFSTKERGRGTGLGLASAYGIIKNHLGFISVTSKKDEGATFSIYLPASKKNVIEHETNPADNAALTSGTQTILLVDDEDIIVDAVGGMLRHLGYALHTARSGQEALEIYKINKGSIDLVILDMIMPGMNGGDTFDQLVAVNPGIKVILCSGYSADGQAAQILKRGCHGFMQKPFTLKELSQRLSEVFETCHQRLSN